MHFNVTFFAFVMLTSEFNVASIRRVTASRASLRLIEMVVFEYYSEVSPGFAELYVLIYSPKSKNSVVHDIYFLNGRRIISNILTLENLAFEFGIREFELFRIF